MTSARWPFGTGKGRCVAGSTSPWDRVVPQCVLPPVQCQRNAPVFKKRHISSSALEAVRKGCSVGKDALAALNKRCCNSLPRAEVLLSHPFTLTIVPSLALCCFLSLVLDPFPLTRHPCVALHLSGAAAVRSQYGSEKGA